MRTRPVGSNQGAQIWVASQEMAGEMVKGHKHASNVLDRQPEFVAAVDRGEDRDA